VPIAMLTGLLQVKPSQHNQPLEAISPRSRGSVAWAFCFLEFVSIAPTWRLSCPLKTSEARFATSKEPQQRDNAPDGNS
jgi:hypothetical protein